MHSWRAVRCANPSCGPGVLPRHVVPACILGMLSGVQTRRAVSAYCPDMWFRHAFLACCPVCKPVVRSRRIAPACGSGMHSWHAVRCANPSCSLGVLPRHVVPACILGVLFRCANPSCGLGVLPRHVVPACILGVLSGVQTRRAAAKTAGTHCRIGKGGSPTNRLPYRPWGNGCSGKSRMAVRMKQRGCPKPVGQPLAVSG